MVATASGEKLLIGRCPVRNWTRRIRYQACFCAENFHLFLERSTKLPQPELHFLTPVCSKSFVVWGFAADPSGGDYSALPDPLAVFCGLVLKGTESIGGEWEGCHLLQFVGRLSFIVGDVTAVE